MAAYVPPQGWLRIFCLRSPLADNMCLSPFDTTSLQLLYCFSYIHFIRQHKSVSRIIRCHAFTFSLPENHPLRHRCDNCPMLSFGAMPCTRRYHLSVRPALLSLSVRLLLLSSIVNLFQQQALHLNRRTGTAWVLCRCELFKSCVSKLLFEQRSWTAAQCRPSYDALGDRSRFYCLLLQRRKQQRLRLLGQEQ